MRKNGLEKGKMEEWFRWRYTEEDIGGGDRGGKGGWRYYWNGEM